MYTDVYIYIYVDGDMLCVFHSLAVAVAFVVVGWRRSSKGREKRTSTKGKQLRRKRKKGFNERTVQRRRERERRERAVCVWKAAAASLSYYCVPYIHIHTHTNHLCRCGSVLRLRLRTLRPPTDTPFDCCRSCCCLRGLTGLEWTSWRTDVKNRSEREREMHMCARCVSSVCRLCACGG